jgi:hypothetical protein
MKINSCSSSSLAEIECLVQGIFYSAGREHEIASASGNSRPLGSNLRERRTVEAGFTRYQFSSRKRTFSHRHVGGDAARPHASRTACSCQSRSGLSGRVRLAPQRVADRPNIGTVQDGRPTICPPSLRQPYRRPQTSSAYHATGASRDEARPCCRSSQLPH